MIIIISADKYHVQTDWIGITIGNFELLPCAGFEITEWRRETKPDCFSAFLFSGTQRSGEIALESGTIPEGSGEMPKESGTIRGDIVV